MTGQITPKTVTEDETTAVGYCCPIYPDRLFGFNFSVAVWVGYSQDERLQNAGKDGDENTKL